MVPVGMIELNKAHSSFHETPRQQAVSGKARFLWILDSIQVERLFAFSTRIHQFRCAGLHSIGHFVRIDASCNFFVTGFC